MTAKGHPEKGSRRAYVFRYAPIAARNRAVPALTISASTGHRLMGFRQYTILRRTEEFACRPYCDRQLRFAASVKPKAVDGTLTNSDDGSHAPLCTLLT